MRFAQLPPMECAVPQAGATPWRMSTLPHGQALPDLELALHKQRQQQSDEGTHSEPLHTS